MNDNALIIAAADLSGSAPRAWTTFIEQLKQYSERKRDDMMRAPPDMIHAAQGRALQASQFFELMRDCRSLAEKVQLQVRR